MKEDWEQQDWEQQDWEQQDWQERIADWIEESKSPAEELPHEADAEAAKQVAESLLVHGLLTERAEDESKCNERIAAVMAAIDEASVSPQGESRWEAARDAIYDFASNYITLSLVVSTLAMAIIVLSMGLIHINQPQPGPVEPVVSAEFVAKIIDTREATFDKTSNANFKNRDLFDDDKIVLNSGLAVIEYDTGARVVLEGPATYHVDGANGGDLRVGKLVARVDTVESQGFAVLIPNARVVDLGTEFGVDVREDGSSQVAVLSGEIELIETTVARRDAQKWRLSAGNSASVTPGADETIRRIELSREFSDTLRRRLQVLNDVANDFPSEPRLRVQISQQQIGVNRQPGWLQVIGDDAELTATITRGYFQGARITVTGSATRSSPSGEYFAVDHLDGPLDSVLSGGQLTNRHNTDVTLSMEGLPDGVYSITTYHHTPWRHMDGASFDLRLTDSLVTNETIHNDIAASFGRSIASDDLCRLVTTFTVSEGKGRVEIVTDPEAPGFDEAGAGDHVNLNGFELKQVKASADASD